VLTQQLEGVKYTEKEAGWLGFCVLPVSPLGTFPFTDSPHQQAGLCLESLVGC